MDEQNTGVDTPNEGVTPDGDVVTPQPTPDPEPQEYNPQPQQEPVPAAPRQPTVREQLYAEGNVIKFQIPETADHKAGHKLDVISIGNVEFKDLVVGETYDLPKEIVNLIRGIMHLNIMAEGQAHDGQ